MVEIAKRPFRFSLIGLVWSVIIAGFGLGGLRHATWAWAAAANGALISALFVAIIGMLTSRREARVFWAGFASFGWGYLLLSFFAQERYLSRVPLPTSIVINYGWEELSKIGTFRSVPNKVYHSYPSEHHFAACAHAMFSAIFAIAGGVLCRYFYLRERQDHRKSLDDHTS